MSPIAIESGSPGITLRRLGDKHLRSGSCLVWFALLSLESLLVWSCRWFYLSWEKSLGGKSNPDRESEVKCQAAIATVFLLFPQKLIMLSGTKTRSTSAITSTSFATGTAVA
jgi:hypothetical protein